jgi:raffinose/stachyose/melibiose transport system substrate-binding protein
VAQGVFGMNPPKKTLGQALAALRHARGRCALCLVAGLLALPSWAQPQPLYLETWRSDDASTWAQDILPVFSRVHPAIRVQVMPSQPVNYDAEVAQRLQQGRAGDLISCRAFDRSLKLYSARQLEDLTELQELRQFRSLHKLAWTSDYGERRYCMPVAAVMTGFFYNKAIFQELGLAVPETEEALLETLDPIQRHGQYAPLAFGTQDAWQADQVLFNGIGPNHWGGERGRIEVLTGKARFTDGPFVNAWRALARLAPYLPAQHHTLGEHGARELFLSGRAAIYPAGSWEIRFLAADKNAQRYGVFAPPPPKGQPTCHVLNHLDMGIGVNAATAHMDEALRFVRWLTTKDFAEVLANKLHGFFPLSNHLIDIQNPLAREMASWRRSCETTIRINSQLLNRAWPQMEAELWRTNVQVLRQEMSPEEAARHISSGVQQWYKPL